MRKNEVTTSWLASVLGVGTPDVTDLRITTVGTGQVADTYRVTFAVGGARRSLIAKLTSEDPLSRDTGIRTADYLREVRFYQELAGTLGVNVPGCVLAEVDDAGEEFALILEDLAPAAQGDQLAGCTLTQGLSAMRQISRLHAHTWEDAEAFTLPYLSRPSFTADNPPDYGPLADLFVERFPHFDTPLFDAIARPYFDRAPEFLLGNAAATPRSLIHGDFRLDNTIIDADDGVTVVDWQTLQAGAPMLDVAYFVATSFLPDDRRRHERELVTAYHTALTAQGVRGYSLEQCFADYQRNCWYALHLGVAASLAVKRTERGDAMFCAMASRGLEAMADHDTLGVPR